MNIETIHKCLCSSYPNLRFIMQRGSKGRISIAAGLRHRVTNFQFEVKIELCNDTLNMWFYFGTIKPSYQTLFYLNKFNDKSADFYKAYIHRTSKTKKIDVLVVKYKTVIKSESDVPAILNYVATNLSNYPEFMLLYRLTDDCDYASHMN